jgi:hypothetical protein
MSARNSARYLAACRDPQVWRRTLMLGLPVGFMQAALNQGDHWWRHEISGVLIAKTILSPLLACSIAFVSAAATYATRNLDSPTS